MPMSGNRNHIIHIELLALARIQRADTGINVVAEQSQFFDVMKHLPSDVLLVRCRQFLHLSESLFQCLRHVLDYITAPLLNAKSATLDILKSWQFI
jgi:hypothetical protein